MATAFPRPLLAPVTRHTLPTMRWLLSSGGNWPSLLNRSWIAVIVAVTKFLCPTDLAADVVTPGFEFVLFMWYPVMLAEKLSRCSSGLLALFRDAEELAVGIVVRADLGCGQAEILQAVAMHAVLVLGVALQIGFHCRNGHIRKFDAGECVDAPHLG